MHILLSSYEKFDLFLIAAALFAIFASAIQEFET